MQQEEQQAEQRGEQQAGGFAVSSPFGLQEGGGHAELAPGMPLAPLAPPSPVADPFTDPFAAPQRPAGGSALSASAPALPAVHVAAPFAGAQAVADPFADAFAVADPFGSSDAFAVADPFAYDAPPEQGEGAAGVAGVDGEGGMDGGQAGEAAGHATDASLRASGEGRASDSYAVQAGAVQASDPFAVQASDPFAVQASDPFATIPSASDPFAGDSFGTADPFGAVQDQPADPFAQVQEDGAADPFVQVQEDASDPFAQVQEDGAAESLEQEEREADVQAGEAEDSTQGAGMQKDASGLFATVQEDVSDPFASVGDVSDPFGSVGDVSDPFASVGDASDPFGSVGDASDPFGSVEQEGAGGQEARTQHAPGQDAFGQDAFGQDASGPPASDPFADAGPADPSDPFADIGDVADDPFADLGSEAAGQEAGGMGLAGGAGGAGGAGAAGVQPGTMQVDPPAAYASPFAPASPFAAATTPFMASSDPFGASSAPSDPFGASSAPSDPFGASYGAGGEPYGASAFAEAPGAGGFAATSPLDGWAGQDLQQDLQEVALGGVERRLAVQEGGQPSLSSVALEAGAELERPARPLAAFGFGGRLVLVAPGSSVVRLQRVADTARDASTHALREFPGPITQQTTLEEARRAVEAMLARGRLEECGMEAKGLLPRLLLVLLTHAAQGATDQAVVAEALCEVLRQESRGQEGGGGVGLGSGAQEWEEGALQAVQELLAGGRLRAACLAAADGGLWAHALLLAGRCEAGTREAVGARFVQACVPRGSQLHSCLMACAGRVQDAQVDAGSWAARACLLLASPAREGLGRMGDRLLAGGLVGAAHACYLAEGRARARPLLLGVGRGRAWGPAALQATELLHRLPGPPAPFAALADAQLRQALLLADHGLLALAASYLHAARQACPPGPSALRTRLEAFAARLETARKKEPFFAPLLKKVMQNILGDDAPQAPAPAPVSPSPPSFVSLGSAVSDMAAQPAGFGMPEVQEQRREEPEVQEEEQPRRGHKQQRSEPTFGMADAAKTPQKASKEGSGWLGRTVSSLFSWMPKSQQMDLGSDIGMEFNAELGRWIPKGVDVAQFAQQAQAEAAPPPPSPLERTQSAASLEQPSDPMLGLRRSYAARRMQEGGQAVQRNLSMSTPALHQPASPAPAAFPSPGNFTMFQPTPAAADADDSSPWDDFSSATVSIAEPTVREPEEDTS